jgi:hypothetical protein
MVVAVAVSVAVGYAHDPSCWPRMRSRRNRERCLPVVALTFPSGQAMGTLDWAGKRAAPVLASGVVTVPHGVEIALDVQVIESVRRTDRDSAFHSTFTIKRLNADGSTASEVREDSDESWEITGSGQPADLGFLRQLPADSIAALYLRAPIVPESLAAVPHLAPGLRRLYLAWADLTDDALTHVSKLHGLTYLQTFGNRFTDRGVQQLAALSRLESLYLEEETLSAAAYDFAVRLPHLSRLGVQDVPLTEAELAELRRRLPGVAVH